jgi:hypothetical protein
MIAPHKSQIRFTEKFQKKDNICNIEELIKAVNQLDETDLDRLLHQVIVLCARRKAQVLLKEAQLL